MSRNEKTGHGVKQSRPKMWSGARRPAGPATTALLMTSAHRDIMVTTTKVSNDVGVKM